MPSTRSFRKRPTMEKPVPTKSSKSLLKNYDTKPSKITVKNYKKKPMQELLDDIRKQTEQYLLKAEEKKLVVAQLDKTIKKLERLYYYNLYF